MAKPQIDTPAAGRYGILGPNRPKLLNSNPAAQVGVPSAPLQQQPGSGPYLSGVSDVGFRPEAQPLPAGGDVAQAAKGIPPAPQAPQVNLPHPPLLAAMGPEGTQPQQPQSPVNVKTWQDYAAMPEVKALSNSDYDVVRKEYFKRTIVPNINAEEIEGAWAEFDSQSSRSTGDKVLSVGRDLAQAVGIMSEETKQTVNPPKTKPGEMTSSGDFSAPEQTTIQAPSGFQPKAVGNKDLPGPSNYQDIEWLNKPADADRSDFWQGVKTGYQGSKQIGTAAAIAAITEFATGQGKQIAIEHQVFDQIDNGVELQDIVSDLKAKGQLSPMIQQRMMAYRAAQDQETRDKLRSNGIKIIESNAKLVGELVGTWHEFGKKMMKEQGRVVNFTDAKDIQDYIDWAQFSLGQAIPYMTVSLMSGVLGTLLGGPVGGALGVFGAGYTMGVGDIKGEFIEDGHPWKGNASSMIGAVPYASLELLTGPVGRIFGRVSPGILKRVTEGYFKRLGRDIPANAFGEFVNELGQEAIKDIAVKLETGEEIITDKALINWFNAGMAGMVAGGGMSVGTAALKGKGSEAGQEKSDAKVEPTLGAEDQTPKRKQTPYEKEQSSKPKQEAPVAEPDGRTEPGGIKTEPVYRDQSAEEIEMEAEGAPAVDTQIGERDVLPEIKDVKEPGLGTETKVEDEAKEPSLKKEDVLAYPEEDTTDPDIQRFEDEGGLTPMPRKVGEKEVLPDVEPKGRQTIEEEAKFGPRRVEPTFKSEEELESEPAQPDKGLDEVSQTLDDIIGVAGKAGPIVGGQPVEPTAGGKQPEEKRGRGRPPQIKTTQAAAASDALGQSESAPRPVTRSQFSVTRKGKGFSKIGETQNGARLLESTDGTRAIQFPDGSVLVETDKANRLPAFQTAEESATNAQPSLFSAANATDTEVLARQSRALSEETGRNITLTPVETPSSAQSVVNAIRNMFGTRVVFFADSEDVPSNGMFNRSIPGVIFLNAGSTKPFEAVAAHEILHRIRSGNPELYQKLKEAVLRRAGKRFGPELGGRATQELRDFLRDRGAEDNTATPASLPADRRRALEDHAMEEMIADAIGDSAMRTDFWGQLATQEPTTFRRIAKVIRHFINKLLRRVPKNVMGSQGYLKNLRSLDRELASLMKSQPQMSDDGEGGTKFSRKPKVTTTGKVIGAPPGMGTEADLAKLVRKIVGLLEDPMAVAEKSWRWYEDVGAAVRKVAHGDEELMEKTIRLLALYSQGNQIGGNVTATVKSLYQIAKNSDRIRAGRFPNTTAERIPALLSAKEFNLDTPGASDKIVNFYRNLHDPAFGENKYPDAVTMDKWMMRLFGYKVFDDEEGGAGASSLSPTQYQYAAHIVDEVAAAYKEKTGKQLLPRQVQAILWTYKKNVDAREDWKDSKLAANTLISAFEGDADPDAVAIVDNAKSRLEKLGKKFQPDHKTFVDYINRALARVTYETVPSTRSPVLREIHTATPEQKKLYDRVAREILLDRTGADELVDLINSTPLYFNELSVGSWQGSINPNSIMSLVLPKLSDKRGADAYDREAAAAYASAIGILFDQDSVAWFRADPTLTGRSAARGFSYVFSDPLSASQEMDLYNAVRQKIPGAEFTRLGDREYVFINFRDADTGKPFGLPDSQFSDKLLDVVSSMVGEIDIDASRREFRSDGELIEGEENGQGYRSRISKAGRPDILSWVDYRKQKLRDVQRQFAEDQGWGTKFSRRKAADSERAVRPDVAGTKGGALRQADVGDGRGYTGFFASITLGKTGKPSTGKKYESVLDTKPVSGFVSEYNKHRGNFDEHIGASIPGFRDLQSIVGKAIVDSVGSGTMLDIGASEGALAKTITKLSDGKIKTVALDPSPAMRDTFNKVSKVPGATYAMNAFGLKEQEGKQAWVEDAMMSVRLGPDVPNPYAGTKINYFKPTGKFDVVHEAMVFQFMSNNRKDQVERVAELLKDNGIAIFEEKFIPGDGMTQQQFDKNEAKKDDFKNQYFSKQEISEKQKAVLMSKETEQAAVGMDDLMVAPAEMERVLKDNFNHVVQFWDSGNFKGFVASNDVNRLSGFLDNLSNTNSEFSTTKTPSWVTDEPPKTKFSRPAFEGKVTDKDDSFSVSVVKALAQQEAAFQMPTPKSKDLGEIFAEISPNVIKVERMKYPLGEPMFGILPEDRKEWRIRVKAAPGTGNRSAIGFVISERDKVWIDVSDFEEGVHRGGEVYQGVSTFAYNNGLTFIGDPAGLSNVARARRVNHMISSAMRYGTTRHIEPHAAQFLEWTPGDDAKNMDTMIKEVWTLTSQRLPILRNVVYNFGSGRFENRKDGKEVTDGLFDEIANEKRTRAASAGRSTLKRAALFGTLVREASEGRRRKILGDALRQSSSQLDKPLRGILYSRKPAAKAVGRLSDIQNRMVNTSSEAFRKWFGKSVVTQDSGDPLKVYHGTSKDKDFAKFNVGTRGAFFTESAEEASQYSIENDSMRMERDPAGGPFSMKPVNDSARVIPVYLSIKNPFVPSPAELKEYQQATSYRNAQKSLAAKAIARGHDGIKLPGGVWVALDPGQIKSAISNNGQFDPGNPAIMFSRKEDEAAKSLALYGKDETAAPEGALPYIGTVGEDGKRFLNYKRDVEYVHVDDLIAMRGNNVLRGDKGDHPGTRKSVEGLKKEIKSAGGLREPVLLQVGKESRTAIVGEGNHRVQAAKELGYKYVPTRAMVQMNTYGESKPKPRDDVIPVMGEYFPSDAKPSAVLRNLRVANDQSTKFSRKQIESPEFKKWFGKSVVKSGGEPLLMFHAAGEKFDTFKTPAYFVSDRDAAEDFSPKEKSRIIDVYLSIKNPVVIDDFIEFSNWTERDVAKYAKQGYDGAVLGKTRPGEPKMYIAFKPTQIKSATRNDGSFGVDNPSILHARQQGTATMSPSMLRWYRDRAQKAVDFINKMFDPLGALPALKDYEEQRMLTQGAISKANDVAKQIGDVFNKASDTDRIAVYQYLSTRGAVPDAISDAQVKSTAVRVKAEIGRIGDALVQRGLLDEDSREQYRDQYLPRLYLKHLLNKDDYRALGSGKKPSDMGYLKKRKDIPEDVRRLILGEIKDPGFLSAVAIARPLRDMALLDWLHQISGNENWVLPGSTTEWGMPGQQPRIVSSYWLKEESQRILDMARRMKGQDKADAIALAESMGEAADAALEGLPPDRKGYRQVPDAPRYGRLRGMWVREEIYKDIMGIDDLTQKDTNWFSNLMGYGGIGTWLTQRWKTMKVALNLPGQVRNGVSNLVLLHLSGIPGYRIPGLFMKAFKDLMEKGPMYQRTRKWGLTEGTFSSQELGRLNIELTKLEVREGTIDWMGWVQLAGASLMNFAGDAYQLVEAVGKSMKMEYEIEANGLSEADAARLANEALFDYSRVPQWVRAARNMPVGMPFITFQYKVLPRIAETALMHPQRFLPYAALFFGWPFALAALNDVDDDDFDALRKALPEWIQQRGHAVLMPWRGEDGKWVALDLGYFMPWSFYTELAGNTARLDARALAMSTGMLTGPLSSLIVAITTGKDSFTKKDIWHEGDPPDVKMGKMMTYLWSLSAPPMITTNGTYGRVKRAWTGETYPGGDVKSTYGKAAASLFGVNMYSIDPDLSRQLNLRRMSYELESVNKALARVLSDRGLSPEQRKKQIEKYKAESRRRSDEIKAYMQESKVHPRLKSR